MELFEISSLSAALLSRLQFAFTISFHIIWPTMTIGLGLFLLIMETLWLKTGNFVYLSLYKFFVKIFALAFGMGVVTGIPLSYQFGTNFSELSRTVGPILGPLLSVEVMTAFFIEASFIGVMIFGWNRVSAKMHYLATLFVVLGTHNSAFWIIAANSWMHTPQGHEVIDGIYQVVDWSQVIFNPSMPFRLAHMLLASYITGALMITGICAWYLIRRQHLYFAKFGFSMGLWALVILAPLQIFAGDMHGLNTLKHQPAKVSAMEGLWQTQKGAPLVLFAIPDAETETNKFAVEVPKLASLILTHDLEGEVKGLNEFAKENRPPVAPVFFAFRVMVGLGMAFLGVALLSLLLRATKKLFEVKPFLWICIILTPAGFIATIAGWYVTEIGRQPWVVYGLMRVSEAISPVTPNVVLASLIGFIIIYGLLFCAFIYYSHHLVHNGPLALSEADLRKQTKGRDDDWISIAAHTTHLYDLKNKRK
jgi:cytochrome bd ubiquinol oxidase subunit I